MDASMSAIIPSRKHICLLHDVRLHSSNVIKPTYYFVFIEGTRNVVLL
jgi:hypothetical protein